MGFYFRKSKGFLGGLFRLNFSKKGIGISTGVKGARFVVGPAGTYVHLGRNGFYYKKYLGKNLLKTKKDKDKYDKLSNSYHIPESDELPNTLTTKNFDKVTDSESSEFIQELENKNKKIRFINIFGIIPTLLILAFVGYKTVEIIDKVEEHQTFVIIKNKVVNLRDQPSTKHSKILAKSEKGDKFQFIKTAENNWVQIITSENDTAFVHGNLVSIKEELTKSEIIRRFDDSPNMRYTLLGLTFLPLLFWNIFLYLQDKKRKSLFITYELDDTLEELQKEMIASFKSFTNSRKIWQVISAKQNSDSKYNAGAHVTVDRKEIKNISTHKVPSDFFQTNVKIPFIGLQNTELYFLPDKLLLKRNKKFAAIQYSNLEISIFPVSFREYSGVPSDATISDYTYKFVNKSGGPDRRFSDNPKVPICAYTEYQFTSDEGINEIIMPSKTDAMDNFVIQLQTIGSIQNGYSPNNTSELQTTYNIPQFDPLFQESANLFVNKQDASASLLQRKLKIGYNRAGKIIDELEQAEIISAFNGEKRTLLIKNHTELNSILNSLSNSDTSYNEAPSNNSISKEYYDMLVDFSHHLASTINKLTTDEGFIESIKDCLTESTTEEFISYCVMYDITQIFKLLTDGILKKDTVEMSGLVLLSTKIINKETDFLVFNYETISESHSSGKFKEMADSILNISNQNNPLKIEINESKDDELISSEKMRSALSLPAALKLLDHPLFDDYITTLYRFATIIAKADSVITKKEEVALNEIYQITHNPIPEEENNAINISEVDKVESLDEVLKELDGLIGLNEVKKEVKTLINFVQVQKEREKQGLKSSQVSYHCVFTGSPGTGKTTIARLVAKIYKHLGILEQGQLVETDRSGLVAEYLGQTSTKVDKVVKTALNGILFIDEAYALVGEGNDDYGKEAVAALIKRMEDNRDKLVLIVAGYSDEMETFIDTNPGFKSRFNRYIQFPDYTPIELMKIFELLCLKSEYVVSQTAKDKLNEKFESLYKNKDKNFGNGRLVRNLFEKAMEQQANRIAQAEKLTKELLTTIEAEDIA